MVEEGEAIKTGALAELMWTNTVSANDRKA